MKTLLALDQSSQTTGWAIFKNDQLFTYGKFTISNQNIGIRLNKIRKKIIELIEDYNVTEIVFEDIYLDGQKINNVQTFKVLAEVFGIVWELAEDLKIPNSAVLAGTWKSTLGIKGKTRAEQKRNAQAYVIEHIGEKPTQDEADAICIGVHHITHEVGGYDWG